MSKNLIDRAVKILAAYPNTDTVYFTSDGSPFIREVDAKNHAKSLDDKTVTPIAKADAAAQSDNNKGGNAGGNTADKPVKKMNVEELKAEAAKREGLVVEEGATRKQLVDAIEKYDAEKAAAAEGNQGDAATTEEGDKE